MIYQTTISIPTLPWLEELEYTNNAGRKLGAFVPDHFAHVDYFADILQKHATNYAATYLRTVALDRSPLYITKYEPGMYDPEHIDQYENREGTPDAIDRTVSCSVILQRADEGGEFFFQDYEREQPIRILNPDVGGCIFFPGDWWHAVFPVERGIRRSLIYWWGDTTGERFRSKPT